jgi:DNA processing protein
MEKDQRYWVGFSRIAGIGPARLRLLLDHMGDIESAWHASIATLRALGFNQRLIESFHTGRTRIDLDAEMARIQKAGVQVLNWTSPAYPGLLKEIPDPPVVLYVRGELLPQDEFAIGVVGTRKASVYGREATFAMVHDLAASGLTIVSGLAYGIDTCAHQTAVDAGGRTIAVLGSGVDVIYPRQNSALARRILDQGAIISEYPLGSRPEARNFPPRNRIISGLCLGVLVVEGAVSSGSMITARYAVEQGREVFAIPGNILNKNSSGPSHLIQQGAKLVTSIGDILEELNLTMVTEQTQAREVIPDNETEALIIQHLSSDPIHIDDLGRATGLPVHEVSGTLTLMELKGKVRQVGVMNYVLARESGAPYHIH